MRNGARSSLNEQLGDDRGNVWPPLPTEETELSKALRIQEETKAAAVSALIDEAIENTRLESQKQREQIRILLLGQAESGKSTVLKNFQLQYAPKAFQAETRVWLAVIHLNLTCFVNAILDRIQPGKGENPTQYTIEPDTELRRIKMQLRPLRQVEDILSRCMSADKNINPTGRSSADMPWSNDQMFVRSGSGWKFLLGLRKSDPSGPNQLDESRQILNACKEDIAALWQHPLVLRAFVDQHITLQEQAGFFLQHASRVCDISYEPTQDDVLRARLGTLGVEEHRLTLETDERYKEYIIYDVGGSRSQRAAWASYFDDVSVMIFLVPISAFNQVLAEDQTVNRLLDSFQLWRTICGSKLLANITIILLLNKYDLLAEKLDSGIQFSKYVTSYKDQPNDAEHVTRYLKAKFAVIHKQFSPKRALHTHVTCAIDIDATSLVLGRIREVLLRTNLTKTNLI